MYGFIIVWKKKDTNDTSNDVGFVKRVKEFAWADIDGPCVWSMK